MGRVYQDPSAGTCPNLTVLENLSLADNKGKKKFGLGRGVNKKTWGLDFYRATMSSWPVWAWAWRISWMSWALSPAASGRPWRC